LRACLFSAAYLSSASEEAKRGNRDGIDKQCRFRDGALGCGIAGPVREPFSCVGRIHNFIAGQVTSSRLASINFASAASALLIPFNSPVTLASFSRYRCQTIAVRQADAD